MRVANVGLPIVRTPRRARVVRAEGGKSRDRDRDRALFSRCEEARHLAFTRAIDRLPRSYTHLCVYAVTRVPNGRFARARGRFLRLLVIYDRENRSRFPMRTESCLSVN